MFASLLATGGVIAPLERYSSGASSRTFGRDETAIARRKFLIAVQRLGGALATPTKPVLAAASPDARRQERKLVHRDVRSLPAKKIHPITSSAIVSRVDGRSRPRGFDRHRPWPAGKPPPYRCRRTSNRAGDVVTVGINRGQSSARGKLNDALAEAARDGARKHFRQRVPGLAGRVGRNFLAMRSIACLDSSSPACSARARISLARSRRRLKRSSACYVPVLYARSRSGHVPCP
jgi:hypothetical protein